MQNILYKILECNIISLVSIIIISVSYPVNCTTSASATFSGTVMSIGEISCGNSNTSLTIGSGNTEKLFDFTVSSNSPTGFIIKVSSTNSSELRSGSYSNTNPSTFLFYMVDIVEQLVGGPNTTSTLTELSLTTDKSLIFTQVTPTVEKSWDVMATTSAKALLSGIFQDTITLTYLNN